MSYSLRNRLAICTFFHESGRLENYCKRLLENISPFTSKIILVANCNLDTDAKEYLSKHRIDFLERENRGLDFGAWKAGLNLIGLNNLHNFDDLLIFNFTCYGPIFSLENIFNSMDEDACDFWGITSHPANKNLLIPEDPQSYIRYHIQSYFINFKKSCFNTTFFKFWNNLKEYSNYWEEVAYHENMLTEILIKSGLKSKVILDQKYNETMFRPFRHITENNIPLIKRKLFFGNYDDILKHSYGNQATLALEYIEKNNLSLYNDILDDILKNKKISKINANLHFNYLLSKINSTKNNIDIKYGVLLNVNYETLFENNIQYLKNIPKTFKIFLTSNNVDLLELYKVQLNTLGFTDIVEKKQQIEDRFFNSLFLRDKDILENCDILCCIFDKKIKNLPNICAEEDFRSHSLENMLPSQEYINGILDLFQEHCRLGLLIPPDRVFSSFDPLGFEMGDKRNCLKKLFQLFSIDVPFDECPITSYSPVFWLRCSPLRKVLQRYDYTGQELLEASQRNVEIIEDSIETFIPFLFQEQGFYTAKAFNSSFCSSYINNTTHLLSRYNRLCAEIYPAPSTVMRLDFISKKGGLVVVGAFKKNIKKYIKLKTYEKLRSLKIKLLGRDKINNRIIENFKQYLKK